MTYDRFLEDLNARGMFRIHPSLDRVRKVLSVLGNPQEQYPCIHIAGTNGKGSVSAALESVLRANGYHTGLYTSPHLVDLRERVKIDGSPLIQGFTPLAEDVSRAERRAKTTLTYFEFLTVLAFQSFAKKKVDVAVLECGLGGLWDATNVIERSLVSIITSIGLDHTEWLGNDEQQIAAQKAGIIKRNGHVISGVRGSAANVIIRAAREKNASIDQIDTTFKSESLVSSWQSGRQTIRFLYKGEPPITIPFGLLGSHQADNAALVMATVRRLQRAGFSIMSSKRDKGLRDIYWPGRLQIIGSPKSATLLLDGAHNSHAMKQLLKAIESSIFKNVQKTFVFSSFKDKNAAEMGSMISRLAAEVCLAPLPSSRAMPLKQLRASFSQVSGPVRSFQSIDEALKNAFQDTPRDGLIVVTGSLTLIGEVLKRTPSARMPAYV